MKQKNKKPRAYHHGNLRAALVDVAQRLIIERGPHGFTLVEAATLAGVSPAAPYRHFSNREALLAEVARTGFERFSARLESAWNEGQPDPLTAFSRMGSVYLDFARYERASYVAMFEAGLKGDEVEGLGEVSASAFAVLTKAAAQLGGKMSDGKPIAPEILGAHVWALSHGMATLFASPKQALDPRCPGEICGDANDQGLHNIIAGDMDSLFRSGLQIYLKGLGIEFPDRL